MIYIRIRKQSIMRTPMFTIKHHFAWGESMVDIPGNIYLCACGEGGVVRWMRYPIHILHCLFILVIFQLKKLSGALFEATFTYYFLEIDMNVVGVHINYKIISMKGNVKREFCFTCRNYVCFDVWSFRNGEIFILLHHLSDLLHVKYWNA